jgi:hypothetical protein
MKSTVFENTEEPAPCRMRAHWNTTGKPVIVIESINDQYDCHVYVFEDTSEVEDFIEHLKELL